MSKRHAVLLPALLALAAWAGCATAPSGDVPVFGYRVVGEYPHSTDSFTEGLQLEGGLFYEGTGLYGRSKLLKVEPATGQVLSVVDLGEEYFGEGVAVLGDEVFQLTWTNNVGFVYDRDTLLDKRVFSYPTQGWGLTTDGESLIMSDGSAVLRFLDPETMEVRRSVTVEDDNGPIANINELEYVDGAVYANIWKQDRVARISPRDGRVTAWIDLTGLNPYAGRDAAEFVLNGIAWNRASGRLIVTGKCWPVLYEIQLMER